MCAFSFAITVAVALYERTFPACARVPTGRQAVAAAKARGEKTGGYAQRWREDRRFFLNSILAIPACFWILDISQLFQSGAVSTYTSNLADAISVTRGATLYTAGWNASVAQVIPIVLTPVLGCYFDRFGRRMHWGTSLSLPPTLLRAQVEPARAPSSDLPPLAHSHLDREPLRRRLCTPRLHDRPPPRSLDPWLVRARDQRAPLDLVDPAPRAGPALPRLRVRRVQSGT